MGERSIAIPVTSATIHGWVPKANADLCRALVDPIERLRKPRAKGSIRIGRVDVPLSEWDNTENLDKTEKNLNQDLRESARALLRFLHEQINLLGVYHSLQVQPDDDGSECESEYSRQRDKLIKIVDALNEVLPLWDSQRDIVHWHIHAIEIATEILPIISAYKSPKLYENGIAIKIIKHTLEHVYGKTVESKTIAKMFERRKDLWKKLARQ